MSKLKIGLAIIWLAAMVLALPAGEKDRYDQRMNMFKDLNLTEAQTKQLENNRKEAMKTMQDNQEKTRKEYKSLFDELAKDNPDAGKVAKIKKNILELEAKRLDSMADNAASLKKVLTKEQFAEFQEKQKNRKTPDAQDRNGRGMRGGKKEKTK